METKYTAEAVSTGDARNGHVRSSDGLVDQDLRMPKELGGAGGASNPEQLFAAGYAACFHGALRLVAKNAGVQVPEDSTVTAQVGIGPDDGGLGLAVVLTAALPGIDKATADDLVNKAHEVCPYSKATRGNIDVRLDVAV